MTKNDLPVLNTRDLSTLITWAATDDAINSEPDYAVAQGLAKEGDKRLGRWNQSDWIAGQKNGVCQTAHCIAGGAAALAGNMVELLVFAFNNTDDGYDWYSGGFIAPVGANILDGVEVKDGVAWMDKDAYSEVISTDQERADRGEKSEVIHVSAWAQDYLGLTSMEAETLFSGGNSIPRLLSYANEFARNRGVVLDIPEWVYQYSETYYSVSVQPA